MKRTTIISWLIGCYVFVMLVCIVLGEKKLSRDGARQNTMPPRFDTFFHIVVPFYNVNTETFITCIKSLQLQGYPKNLTRIWVFDDASDREEMKHFHRINCSNILDFHPTDNGTDDFALNKGTAVSFANKALQNTEQDGIATTLCIRSLEHIGPAGSKYWAFSMVASTAEPNDVVLVVDGDDRLMKSSVLSSLHHVYTILPWTWFTYGSNVGKFSNETQPIPNEYRNHSVVFQPRADSPTWRFGHPRTFRAHLLDGLKKEDFTFSDGSWLVKATDRGFVYRMLELSGVDRVRFLKPILYKYKWNSNFATSQIIPREVQLQQLQHVKNLTPSTTIG